MFASPPSTGMSDEASQAARRKANKIADIQRIGLLIQERLRISEEPPESAGRTPHPFHMTPSGLRPTPRTEKLYPQVKRFFEDLVADKESKVDSSEREVTAANPSAVSGIRERTESGSGLDKSSKSSPSTQPQRKSSPEEDSGSDKSQSPSDDGKGDPPHESGHNDGSGDDRDDDEEDNGDDPSDSSSSSDNFPKSSQLECDGSCFMKAEAAIADADAGFGPHEAEEAEKDFIEEGVEPPVSSQEEPTISMCSACADKFNDSIRRDDEHFSSGDVLAKDYVSWDQRYNAYRERQGRSARNQTRNPPRFEENEIFSSPEVFGSPEQARRLGGQSASGPQMAPSASQLSDTDFEDLGDVPGCTHVPHGCAATAFANQEGEFFPCTVCFGETMRLYRSGAKYTGKDYLLALHQYHENHY